MTDIVSDSVQPPPKDDKVAPGKSAHKEKVSRFRAISGLRPTRDEAAQASIGPETVSNRDRREEARSKWIRFWRNFEISPLTLQMIVIHIIGLVMISGGLLYLSQTSENLIDAHKRLLEARARILAGTIADAILESGDENMLLNRRDLIPILRRPTSTDGTYARVFNTDGELVTDTDLIHDRIEQIELPPLHKPVSSPGVIRRLINGFSDFLLGSRYDLKPSEHGDLIETNEEGIARALAGEEVFMIRRNEKNELTVSFFTPIQPVQHVVGALVLEVYDIDEVIRAERESIVRLFLVVAAITLVLLALLGQTVVRPIRRLAEAAEIIRRGKTGRAQIPDFSNRNNEIGDLSIALRDMTNALYDRLEENERFAADVAHEIKNPLTSLRSAVETFDLAKNDEMRSRLVEVIKDDVSRIDRLVSDISRISRLDAELARKAARPVDLYALLRAISDMYNTTRKEHDPALVVEFESDDLAREGRYVVSGFEDSLAQVINNLIDNAKSFSPSDGTIRIITRRRYRDGQPIVIIEVEDDGPGIPQENLENIFERFYTQRPDGDSFGTHSGLGLNICRQIVEAHRGTIIAENRYNEYQDTSYQREKRGPVPDRPQARIKANSVLSSTKVQKADRQGLEDNMKVLGARFVISLPADVLPRRN